MKRLDEELRAQVLTTIGQFSEVLVAAKPVDITPPNVLSTIDVDLINPSRWRLL